MTYRGYEIRLTLSMGGMVRAPAGRYWAIGIDQDEAIGKLKRQIDAELRR